jgi:hypothetical protein
MLKSNDAYGNFVELQSSYLATNGFTCEDASWDHTIAYLSDTTKVGRYPIIVIILTSSL